LRSLIGVVTGSKLDKYEERIAWIWPLVEVKGPQWETLNDQQEEFPSRGYVFWPKAQNVERGQLVHFKAKDNGFHKEGGDDFMVVEPKIAFEVLDFRGVGDCEQVRRALSAGITIAEPTTSKVLIWCRGNLVVGPVQLAISPGGQTRFEKSNRERISCFEFQEGDIRQLSYEGQIRWLSARPVPGTAQRYVDWDDDKQALKRALDFAVSQSVSESLERPRQFVDDALDRITKNGMSADLHLKLYQLQRARSLTKDASQITSFAQELISALRRHPTVLKEIDAIKTEERQKAKAQAERDLAAERDELAKTKEAKTTAEQQLASTRKRLEEADAEVKAQSTAIESRVNARVRQVLDDAPGLLAEISLLKPFLGKASNGPAKSTEAWTPSITPWRSVPTRVSNTKDLRTRLNQSFKAHGVPSTVYQPLHAAIAAGLLPVMGGSRAIDALLAYSQVVTGGRSLIVNVTSAIADVENLFGHVHERVFVPHPAGLVDAIHSARSSEGLVLVVLDGINRTATDSFLLPLLRSALRRTSRVSLFHPKAVQADDPYQHLAKIDWPSNLLLAATVVEGPTTIPVSPNVWDDAAFIQTDVAEKALTPTDPIGDVSEIDVSARLLGSPPSFENSDWIQELFPRAQGVAAKFEGGMRVFTNDASALQQAVAKCVLVPHLAAIADSDEREEQIKAAIKAGSAELEALVSKARRQVA
jgi:hypothetical protein